MPANLRGASNAWFFARCTALLLALLVAASSTAADFPQPGKPIRLILPVGPGSAIDVRARQLAEGLGQALGAALVVENRPGAGGGIAAQEAARGAPDGHTLFMGNIQTHVLNDLLQTQPPGLRVDQVFEPVTMAFRAAIMLAVHQDVPARSAKELFALIKTRPGQLQFGTGGLGSTSHLFGEMLKGALGLDMTMIHYKSIGADIADLAGGHIQVGGQFYSTLAPYMHSGKVRVLAVAGSDRVPTMPDVPTLAEVGYPGLDLYGWSGVFVPRGTPPQVVSRLQREIALVLRSKEMSESFRSAGAETGGEPPQQFAAFIQAERQRWGRLIAERQIKAF